MDLLSDEIDSVLDVRAQLAIGAGILTTAKALGVGTGTVHRVKREMTAVVAWEKIETAI